MFLYYVYFQAIDLFDISEGFDDVNAALAKVKSPVLVVGFESDVLYPIWQQREMAQLLKDSGLYDSPAVGEK